MTVLIVQLAVITFFITTEMIGFRALQNSFNY